MKPLPQTRQTDRPAALALIGISALSLGILGYGWQSFFSSMGVFLSATLGLLIAAIALALAYAIATERVQHPHSRATAAAYFFVLFNISALGTTNALFVMFQSTNIFREQHEQAKAALTLLHEAAARALETPEYERFEAQVLASWGNLKREIENPLLCGQGPVAQQRAAELRELLPDFRTLVGVAGCERNGRLVAAYDEQVKELLTRSPQYAASRETAALRVKLRARTEELLDRIRTSEERLSGTYSIPDVKAFFFSIASEYSQLRQELNAKAKVPAAEAPMQIDTATVSALGDIGQIVPFLFSRLFDASTYVYVLIALVLDLTLIAAFARVMRSGSDQRQRLVAPAPRHV
jgi:hypothetical protein